MWRDAQYLSQRAGWSRVICYSGASWASSGENIACCIFFLSVLLSSFSSPFAILFNCHKPWVLPFPSDFPPHPTWGGGEVRESNRVVLWCQLRLNHNILSRDDFPGFCLFKVRAKQEHYFQNFLHKSKSWWFSHVRWVNEQDCIHLRACHWSRN